MCQDLVDKQRNKVHIKRHKEISQVKMFNLKNKSYYMKKKEKEEEKRVIEVSTIENFGNLKKERNEKKGKGKTKKKQRKKA